MNLLTIRGDSGRRRLDYGGQLDDTEAQQQEYGASGQDGPSNTIGGHSNGL